MADQKVSPTRPIVPSPIRPTHFVPYDSPGRRLAQALCGQHVDRQRDHHNEPTCDGCKARHAELEAMVF